GGGRLSTRRRSHPLARLDQGNTGARSGTRLIPAARRADWYARRVGVAAAREIKEIPAARQSTDESSVRAAGVTSIVRTVRRVGFAPPSHLSFLDRHIYAGLPAQRPCGGCAPGHASAPIFIRYPIRSLRFGIARRN